MFGAIQKRIAFFVFIPTDAGNEEDEEALVFVPNF
jgi:hypothetical protein